MEMIELIALILVLVGGLNWGLVGLLNLNLVTLILGSVPILVTIVYDLVGLSALYIAYTKFVKK
jgi:hypothetical protein